MRLIFILNLAVLAAIVCYGFISGPPDAPFFFVLGAAVLGSLGFWAVAIWLKS